MSIDDATDPGPYIRFRLDDTFDVECYIEEHCPGIDIAARTIENALRRGELEYYQVGLKRYVTPKLLNKWLATLVTRRPKSAAAAAMS